MNKLKITTVLLSVFFVWTSCNTGNLEPVAYKNWVENPENGLNVSREAGEFQFTLQYKPLDYVALINQRPEQLNRQGFMKNKEEMKELQYYTLRIDSKTGDEMLRSNLSSADEYFYRVEYFSFHLKKDLYLIDGNDSLPCVLSHFERSYALSPNNNFILAFPLSEKEKVMLAKGKAYTGEKTLVYDDRYLQTGPVKFTIKKDALSALPQLKI